MHVCRKRQQRKVYRRSQSGGGVLPGEGHPGGISSRCGEFPPRVFQVFREKILSNLGYLLEKSISYVLLDRFSRQNLF